ncbi:MAG: hypothetical protein IJG62_03535 [Synergistaceae bacterium]|nr:hypothetical protein [Synergistaceae bacterium]MBQ3627328.1 hypothetical protein [Synergistaceae bacterium]MBQ4419698.1 hypothetical protein [Synergistaceae bacterium]MBQ9896286.1 hypothetical protein [Synergistaceae bacterium]MBR0221412.1 hypothetical protein [Synergistaceae bacterium]
MNENERRAAAVLAGLFILLGIFIACVAFYLYYKSSYLNNLYAELNAQGVMLQISNNKSERDNLTDTLNDLKALNNLLQPLPADVDFQDEVQKIVTSNDVEIISSQVANDDESGQNILNLDLNIKGNYTNIIKVLAEWRALPFPLRIAEFEIKGGENLNQAVSVKLQALIK